MQYQRITERRPLPIGSKAYKAQITNAVVGETLV